jgi:protein-L-isoaspartate O-methyltransferase
MTEWKDRAAGLVAEMTAAGDLDPGWSGAFSTVPRHVFVPSFYREDDTLITGSDPQQRTEWIETVYSNKSLITQQTPLPGTDILWPTSSSTQPGLMARMLGLLEVTNRHSVLEIGTGTGYNAALLSERLGDHHVASIDLDPVLVEYAREALDRAGYRPFLVAGDGAAGIPEHAPYDRIIATCGLPAIPAPLITQLRDRGLIVADLRSEASSALLVAEKKDSDTVEGRFLSVSGHFMWMRTDPHNPLREGDGFATSIDTDHSRQATSTLAPSILDDPEFRFMLAISVPDISSNGVISRRADRWRTLRTHDGSWAEVQTTRDTTTDITTHATVQGGERSVWDEVEATARRWNDLGRPERSRFGLTAHADGAHHVWLDRPDQVLNQ